MTALSKASRVAVEFTEFVNKAVTPFHAVSVVMDELLANGYTRLPEGTPWPAIAPGQKAFFTRNDSSIVAFRVGDKFNSSSGLKLIGSHTDSPNFAIKPKSVSSKGAYHSVGVQCYGGGLWHTWFDRELTVAGRVIVKNPTNPLEMTSRLVYVPKNLLYLPTLAIHLRSAAEREAFGPHKENHLVPIICSHFAESLSAPPATETDDKTKKPSEQSVPLTRAIAAELGINTEDIVDFDLSIVDRQPAAIGGLHDEFIHAPRIDNLLSVFCSLKAIIEADSQLADDDMVTVLAMFDHEEVGSSSPQGAGGSMVTELVDYVVGCDPTLKIQAVSNSFLLSVDGAHAAHPNYLDKHEEKHRPTLHLGPAIKYNANVRYATTGVTSSVLKALATSADIPVQQFCVKNDSPCGSTIGPILSTLSGIKTADLGNAMLSMHSIRETCGTVDVLYLKDLLAKFIVDFKKVAIQNI